MLSAGAELLLVYRRMDSDQNQYQSVCKSGGGGGGYVFTFRARAYIYFWSKQKIIMFFIYFALPGGVQKW